jgi:hypothetical protein
MGISVFYRGRLAGRKTVDEVVSHIEDMAKVGSLRSQRPVEFSDGGKFRFQIPQQVIDNPDAVHCAYSNRERILKYAQEARLPTEGIAYENLCQALNSTEFIQVGVYLWAHKQAEPLRFLFVEGDVELTELSSDWLQGDRAAEPIRYVRFQRDSLATKTGYEHDSKAHQKALDVLREVNALYFGGKMRIVNPD